ncbi:MAG: tetratricopeptide repeat protein [Elainellaceae cyanobacterium]
MILRHLLPALVAGLTSTAALFTSQAPAHSQAVVPHVPPIEPEQLQQQGLILAQEAAQLAQIQQFELALPRAQLASQLANDTPEVWLLLGRIYLQLGELQPSVVALEKARSLEPDDPAALFDLGTVYFRLEDYQQSIAYLESGLDTSPGVAGAWFDLANAYYKLNQYDKAIDRYSEAVDIEDGFWPAINNIGLVLYEKGDIEDAIEHWEDAVELTEGEEAEPQMAIAVALFTQGNQAQALDQAIAALRLDPRYADLEFLEENLWGAKLLQQTEQFLTQPAVQQSLEEIRVPVNTAVELQLEN